MNEKLCVIQTGLWPTLRLGVICALAAVLVAGALVSAWPSEAAGAVTGQLDSGVVVAVPKSVPESVDPPPEPQPQQPEEPPALQHQEEPAGLPVVRIAGGGRVDLAGS